MKMRELVQLLQQAFQEWLDDRGATLGAALAYYALFSMAPIVLLFIGLAGMLLGREDPQGRAVAMVRGLLGRDGGGPMQQIVSNASHEGTSSIWAAILGGVVMLFGASMVFVELQSSLNIVWGVVSKPDAGVCGFIRARVFSFGLFLSALFVLFVALTLASYVVEAGGAERCLACAELDKPHLKRWFISSHSKPAERDDFQNRARRQNRLG